MPLLLIFLLLPVVLLAQPAHIFNNSAVSTLNNIAVLPDRGYSIDQIVGNAQLPFVNNDSLRPGVSGAYWLKLAINNTAKQAIRCNINVVPNLSNTVYYFDANAGGWLPGHAGIVSAAGNRRLNTSVLPCILRANSINTIYVKVDVRTAGFSVGNIKPSVTIEQESIASKQEQLVWVTWVTSLTVLFLFLLNNIYIWCSFKDKTVLYFVIAQCGGLIYITAYKLVFPVLLPNPVFNIGMHQGNITWYDVNSLLLHSSILVVIYGMVHFARSYLNSRYTFSRLDVLLRYSLNVWLLLSAVFTVVNAFVYMENYTWIIDNIFTLFFFAAIIYMSIKGYVRRLPAAGSFFLANMLSLVFMLGTSLYHLIADLNKINYSLVRSLLPDLAIITQTIGFSIALVTRTRLIQQDLVTKETEVRQLEFDLREMEWRHQLIEQENQTIGTEMQYQKTQNEQLQQKLDANQRELTSITMYMAQKNELLAKLKTQLKDVKKQSPGSKLAELSDVESLLQSNWHLDEEWTKFKMHFEQVHPHFFEELKVKHPNLTKNEIRLSAYFHMNLSTKEIAALLNIDPASVRRAKTRLNKKMGIGIAGRQTAEEE
jgi:DNA-binding CsgD family transcriptional regulator